MDFQKFLSNKMSELGISYRQLENKTGISRGNLSSYINGKKTPTVKTVYRLAIYIAAVEANKENLGESDQQLLKSAYIVGMVRALGEQNVN